MEEFKCFMCKTKYKNAQRLGRHNYLNHEDKRKEQINRIREEIKKEI